VVAAPGAQVLAVQADMTSTAAIEHLVNKAVERFGGVDVW
jgi:NAD(P)-dependent dehydrogenase (short-subunit alcohol dehydrogenase family)